MTWSVRMTRRDGTNPKKGDYEDYSACQTCIHAVDGCHVPAIGNQVGNLLTSVDHNPKTGHMAGGVGVLKCHGYEPVEGAGRLDYQERVIREMGELNEKAQKLDAFMATETFQNLPAEEKEDLSLQYKAMEQYAVALKNRIARFGQ